MRALTKLLLGLILVIIAAAIILPFIIPMDTYKQEITARVEAATGRKLIINGELKAQVLPNIGVELQDVTLSNPEGFSTEYMMQLKSLVVELQLIPLLEGQMKIEEITLKQPNIYLEQKKNGVNNWSFPATSETNADNKTNNSASESPVTVSTEHRLDKLERLKIKKIAIEKGNMFYRDDMEGKQFNLKDLDMALAMPSVHEPIVIESELYWNDKKVRINGAFTTLAKYLEEKSANASLSMYSELINLTYDGALLKKDQHPDISGAITFDSSSLISLASWLENPIEWKGKTSLKTSVKGELSCAAYTCTIQKGNYMLDSINASGELGINLSEAKPGIQAFLTTDELDLRPYIPEDEVNASFAPALISPAHAQIANVWSAEAIDFSPLQQLNAELSLTANTIIIPKLSLGKTAIAAELTKGILKTDISETALFEGTGKGSIVINANNTPSVTKRFSFQNINVGAMLEKLATVNNLHGVGDLQMNITMKGPSEQAMISSMNGDGKLTIKDGAIRGINIAQMARNITSAFTANDETQSTDFSEIAGTFTIVQGVISNQDLKMIAPLLRVSGSGIVNLPAWLINYRIEPKLVKSIEGQGAGEKEAAGLMVPIIIEGSLDRPQFRPDTEGLIKEAITNPEKAKEQVEAVKDQVKDLKEGFKDFNSVEDLKKQGVIEDGVKGLLKGLGN